MAEINTKQIRNASLPPENHEIDLREVVNLIKHNWRLIASITFVFFVCGVFYAQTRPPVYRSTAMIEVVNDSPAAQLGSANSAMSAMGMQQGAAPADVETILLQSPYVLSDVVRQMGMDIAIAPKYSGYISKKIEQWRALPHEVSISTLIVPNEFLAKPLTLIVHNNQRYSLMTSDGKKMIDGKAGVLISSNYLSQPVQIKVDSINAEEDAKFNITKLSTRDVASGLGSGLDVKSEGDSSGVMSLSYVSSSPASAQKILNTILYAAVSKNLAQKSEEAGKVLNFISHQLPESKYKLEDAEFRLNKYSVKTGVFDSKSQAKMLIDNINNLTKKQEELRLTKTMLLQKFTSIHPMVIAITQKEQQIQGQIDEAKKDLAKLPALSQQELNLKGDIKIAGGIYTSLLKNEQEMEMMKAGTISSVKVLSSASYPVGRVPVKKKAIIFGSILFGLMTSLGFIFARFVLSPVIESPDEVEKALGIPVLAIIPYSQKQVTYNKKIGRDKFFAETNPFLLARDNPKDISIESLRSLRTAIQMSLLESKNNVIAITGCRPGVGKSFISSNLSALISDLGKRVLVIDSDIRLGKMHLSFGKQKTPGLSSYLKQEATLENIVQTVEPGKLDFISTGLYPDNPSELLALPALANLIEVAKAQYDLVIIDTPPILAVTDAALILRMAGLNLMALGVGKDQMKEVHHAINMLEKGGVSITGIIFNTLMEQKLGSTYQKYNYHYAYENKS